MHAMCSEPLISPLINIFAYPQLMMATGRIGKEVVEAGRDLRMTLQRKDQPRKTLSPAPRVRILLNQRRSRRALSQNDHAQRRTAQRRSKLSRVPLPRRTAWNQNDHVSQNQRLTLPLLNDRLRNPLK